MCVFYFSRISRNIAVKILSSSVLFIYTGCLILMESLEYGKTLNEKLNKYAVKHVPTEEGQPFMHNGVNVSHAQCSTSTQTFFNVIKVQYFRR